MGGEVLQCNFIANPIQLVVSISSYLCDMSFL